MRNENISILTSDLSARHGVLCPDGGVGFPRWGFFQILCYFFFFFLWVPLEKSLMFLLSGLKIL